MSEIAKEDYKNKWAIGGNIPDFITALQESIWGNERIDSALAATAAAL